MQLRRDTSNFLLNYIVILDRHLNILEVNDARREIARNIFDLPNFSIGSNFIDTVFPSKTDTFALQTNSGIQEIIEGRGLVFELEYPFENSAKKSWFLIRAVRIGKGADLRIIITHENITKRKSITNALLESEQTYRILAETASDAIIRIDENSQIVFVNRAAERVFGYKVEEMVGQSLTMIMPEHLRQFHEAGIKRYLETKKRHINWEAIELPAQHRDGHIFPIEISFGEFQQNGKHFFIGIARNVTERQESRKAMAHLAAIVESSDDSILSKDLDGKITSWNKSAEKMFGYSEAEMLGKPVTLLFPPDYKNEESKIIKRIKKGEQIKHYDTVRRRKDGSDIYVSLTISPIKDQAGNVVGASKIIRDISKRKKNEEVIRKINERFRIAEEASNGFIYDLDPLTRTVERSEAVGSVTGYTNNELGNDEYSWANIIHENDRERVADYFKKVEKGEANYKVEYRVSHKNGYYITVLDKGFIFRDKTGKAVRIIGTAIDITERKVSENLLKENESLALLSSEVSKALIHYKSTQEILAACANSIVEHLDAAFARIWTLNTEKNVLELQASAGIYTHLDGEHSCIPVGKYKIGQIAQERKPHLTNSVIGDERVSNQEWAKNEKMTAFAGYPLVVEDNLVGVIGMFSRNIVGEATFNALASIANTIALGIKRKQVEEARFESEERLRLATEAADMFSWEFDVQNQTVLFSENFEKMSGFALNSSSLSFEETLGKFIHPDDAEKLRQSIEDSITENNFFQSETRSLNTKGETVWLESYGNIIRSGSTAPVKIVGVTQNITERKRIEEQIKESEQNLRTLANSIPQLAWMAQPDGHIFWCNQRWYDYTGITPKQMQGWGWKSVQEAEILPKVVERWKHSVETGEPFEMEFRLRGADGKFRWFLTQVNPLRDSQGKILRWFGTNTDIDDAKQIELEREAIFKREKAARHEAEEANRTKDEFLSVLSHELRTPLNSMLGWVKMLNAGMLDEEKKQHAYTVIERNIRQQNDLIEDLLDVSRIISGKMNIESEEVDFASIVATAIENIRPIADGKNISIEFQGAAEQKIIGDETRLNQIVNNLLSNAVKFTPENGNVNVKLSRTNGKIQFEISDTGIGIAPQFLPHIFDRFRQADSTTRRAQSGLGLGLTIVRHLTELHGGKINAASSGAGKGSTFTIELPYKSSCEQTAKPKTTSSIREDNGNLKDVRILLVDDNCEGLQPLKMLLEIKQAVVECVDSAHGALKKLADERFHILISDIGMPDMDGYELLKAVRGMNSSKNREIPAIALTAYASIQDRERALNAGFQQHLSKPIDFDQFLSAIENLVNQTK